jgi:hypothetical protein
MSHNQIQTGHCFKSIKFGNKLENPKLVTIRVQKREKPNVKQQDIGKKKMGNPNKIEEEKGSIENPTRNQTSNLERGC